MQENVVEIVDRAGAKKVVNIGTLVKTKVPFNEDNNNNDNNIQTGDEQVDDNNDNNEKDSDRWKNVTGHQ